MVDKITKSLNKFSDSERAMVKKILVALNSGNFSGLDLKKLKSHENIFRIRKGKIRIIYRLQSGQIYLLAVEKRNDNTYNSI
ncbi:MAG: hypothetical protein A3J93_02815 [Candidatus Magasanikbacteria bacterium RIFOXYC2_FULL_42_28]|uniref:Plasmid stabilization protein n=1 Tax=Candidatus Magasanikbacteria bacterium RIFOXYC2_FULL_42_28 TaxID=1798704 RepID=A0A1F6NUD8_9BACT|nr:MAG: hypothetical protein A3J93_02815 [Candidatus Magasanikbacteria bacterium RIFOXYC2_FULL_42_28]